MKSTRILISAKSLTLAATTIALLTGRIHAAPFLYAPGDLVLAVRQSGGASEYVVNIGKAAAFAQLPPGSIVPISNVSAGQLRSAFPSFNGLQWSVAAANRPPIDPSYPLQTLWISRPRLTASERSAPWRRKGQSLQGNTGAQVDGVGYNAGQASSNLPGGPDNTATGVVIPANHNFNIGQVIGTSANYANHFQGSVEALTPDNFEGDPSSVSRADLFELLPGTTAAGTLNSPGRYLGTFELKPDGSFTFSNAVTLPKPSIAGISRAGTVTTVRFPSVAGVTYRLRIATAAGRTTPVSAWTVGASILGDGTVISLDHESPSPVHFYVLEAQP